MCARTNRRAKMVYPKCPYFERCWGVPPRPYKQGAWGQADDNGIW